MKRNEAEARFVRLVRQNPYVQEVLDRAGSLLPADWYLAAGCLFQTVWNVLEGQDPGRGIRDYDLIYCETADQSWEAEDEVIRRCADAFDDLDIVVEVRNQARVHLWYEDHFGVPCEPIRSSAEAIDRYAARTCQLGMRERDGMVEVYAPAGFDDLFAMVVRPNPVVATREVYESKTARWRSLWPRLEVLPWPA